MGRAVVEACLPWLALLAVSLVAGYLLARLNRSGFRLGRLRQLHRDQGGSAQSLSFVLTLPFFVMIMLFIVQVSQLMIGTIVVHYAAYAAARSAVVWIPARVSMEEAEDRISLYGRDLEAPDQHEPIYDQGDENYGPADGGLTFLIRPGSPKYEKIRSAAVMACMPISPSRDLELCPSGERSLADIVKAAYAAMVPSSTTNARISARLKNKLAYAMQNTDIEIRFFHKNSEPPLEWVYNLPEDTGEFYPNEIGWQDPITVTVRHKLALLPGPGRLLARSAPGFQGQSDEVSGRIEEGGGVSGHEVYVYELTASATMGNEGEKSVKPYVHQTY